MRIGSFQRVSIHDVAFAFIAVSVLLSLLFLLVEHPPAAHGQAIDIGQGTTAAGGGRAGHVRFIAEPATVPAGKSATLQMHFRVDSGFHINTHTPKSEMLIPTKLAVEDGPGVNVTGVDFPQGTLFSFSFEPKEKLDVYTGDVTLVAHLTAQSGSHTLKAAFRYQACDNSACYPPKLLPVELPFTAK